MNVNEIRGECSRNSSASDLGNSETACCSTSQQRQHRGERHIMYLPSVLQEWSLYGDDETDMTEYLETRRRALEDRGMRISRPKTQFIAFTFGQDNGQGREPVKILGEELQRVHRFMYIGASVEETGGMTT